MNLVNSSQNDLLFANFNQDFSCISIGTRKGFKIFNCEPFRTCYGNMEGGIGIVEMLFCTSLVAQVGAGEQPNLSPRCLQLNNTKRQSNICQLSFPTAILAVKLNRQRLVVLLEEKIHIYNITDMKLLYQIETMPNPKGIISLSPSPDNSYIAYPANHTNGDVNIFHGQDLQDLTILQAHKQPISCLSFSFDGSKLATASEKGTVIRVFSMPDGALLYQFRRGSYPTTIYHLNFNLEATLLCCSSESDTIHVFKLDPKNRRPSRTTGVAQFLPGMINDMWEAERDFAYLKIKPGVQSICALSSSTPQVMVITSEGMFYQYNINMDIGKECVLVKQSNLLSGDDSNIPNTPFGN